MSLQLGFNYSYYTPTTPATSQQGLILARVDKVILGPTDSNGQPDPDFENNGQWASIGAIRFTVLYRTQTEESQTGTFARPYHTNVKQYPLIGEIVQLIEGPSPRLNENALQKDLYYLPPYNIWNTVHHNAFPNLIDYSNFVSTQDTNYTAITQGATLSAVTSSTTYPLGNTFKEKSDIKALQPYEGDIIVEGRWGQSIRFGSTVKSNTALNPWSSRGEAGDPIVIIRNGQGKQLIKEAWINTVEDINNDDASIYLCSGQAIFIQDLNNFKLTSFTSGKQLTRDKVQEVNRQPISTDIISPQKQSQFELNSNKKV